MHGHSWGKIYCKACSMFSNKKSSDLPSQGLQKNSGLIIEDGPEMKGQVVQAYRYRADGDRYREREMREERWGSSI